MYFIDKIYAANHKANDKYFPSAHLSSIEIRASLTDTTKIIFQRLLLRRDQ
jgi:hypothetical protein